jgi:catechol 2,3-dioxygenase-like lactoylglutathione lyase family enzyme
VSQQVLLVSLGRTIPALPVRDVTASAQFYSDRLGFEPVHLDSGFAVLRRDDAVVHLWQANDERWRGRPAGEVPVKSGAESFIAGTASCRIEVDDVDELFVEMRTADVLHRTSSTVEDTDFGTREFHVVDLDGNLLSFHRWLSDG